MSVIKQALTLARSIRKTGGTFNPLFVGPPGVGKSQEIQQWCAENNLPFIDLRAAYLESPDLIGFPSIENKNGRQKTVHNVPEFLPDANSAPEGVLLLEEPNRGNTSVMNTFMQLLTDRKVHNYTLPDGWIIVGAINPENPAYEVNTMDPALKNRFVMFEVTYNQKAFVDYMQLKNFHPDVVNFVTSRTWEFILPENVAQNKPGTKYTSPRTIEQLNEAAKAMDANPKRSMEFELAVYDSIMGINYGRAFYNFRHNDAPVSLYELQGEETKDSALKRLKEHCNPKKYKNGHISVTISDILKDGNISDELLTKVLLVLPADQGVILIRDLGYKRNDQELLGRVLKASKDLEKYWKDMGMNTKK